MKYTILLSALLIIVFAACDKDEKNTPPEEMNVRFDPLPSDVLLAQDTLVGAEGVAAKGLVKLYKNDDRQVLRFEQFKIDNGPNYKVYLSKDSGKIDEFVIIGNLLAGAGSFNYSFSTITDASYFRWVTIYAEDSESILAWAELKF